MKAQNLSFIPVTTIATQRVSSVDDGDTKDIVPCTQDNFRKEARLDTGDQACVGLYKALNWGHKKSCGAHALRKTQRVPEIPNELGLLILDGAQANPVQLMALMGTDGSLAKSSTLRDLAHLNKYWTSFTPRSVARADAQEGAYAEAFLTRYKKMSDAQQLLLRDLWSGALPWSEIRHRCMSDRWVLKKYDLALAAVSQKDASLALCYLPIEMQRDPNITQASLRHT